jgi:hypothetical protein
VLSPHAAAFIDPLFSSGILFGVAFTIRLVALAERVLRRDDYDLALAEEALAPLGRAFERELTQVDQIVSGMITSFRSYDVMKQYFRTWVVSSYLEYSIWAGGAIERPEAGGLIYGAGVDRWRDVVGGVHAMVRDWSSDSASLAKALKERLDALPPENPERFPIASDRPCVVRANNRPYVARWLGFVRDEPGGREVRAWRLRAYGLETARRWATLHVRTLWSRLSGGSFHQGTDFVRRLRLSRAAGWRTAFREAPRSSGS